jgi:hypothetical protein
MIVNLLILVSQTANVVLGGDPDEMTSSRAWRLRKQPGWRELCWMLDNASPLMGWRGIHSTHCEACYYAEKKRLEERLLVYKDMEPEDVQEG